MKVFRHGRGTKPSSLILHASSLLLVRRGTARHPLPTGEGRCGAPFRGERVIAEQSAPRRGEGLSVELLRDAGDQRTRSLRRPTEDRATPHPGPSALGAAKLIHGRQDRALQGRPSPVGRGWRRLALPRALVLSLLLPLVSACHGETPVTSNSGGEKPDIILVTIDTLRADAVGYSGNAKVRTPFLDRMAGEGLVFTNAHAHNVVTLASHANILTGLYPFQHGVRDNSGFKLDPKYPTVASMLKEAGYTTGAFVGAFPLDSRFGLNHGFDTYDDNYGKGTGSLDCQMQERPASAVCDAAAK